MSPIQAAEVFVFQDPKQFWEREQKPRPVSARSYDAKAVSSATAVRPELESIVQQHEKDEVDINRIVERFGITFTMPSGPSGGLYGDFSEVTDWDDAIRVIRRAQDGFMTLPPEVRERFGNDPGRLIAFAQGVSEEDFSKVLFPQVGPAVPAVEKPAGGDAK